MKKILKYSTIIGTAVMLTGSVIADTGGYVRVKGMESHFKSLGFNQVGCTGGGPLSGASTRGTDCKFASEIPMKSATGDGTINAAKARENNLAWSADDGTGIIAGADYGFFRLEIEATYQDSNAQSWRGHAATNGQVHQARLFGNVVVEPLDLLETLGVFGGIDPLVRYNPASYGISPYAMYGYGIMGGLVENLAYTRNKTTGSPNRTSDPIEEGTWAGGATAAVNVGAGVNIGLDKLARGFTSLSGASLPEYFKLPIEFSIGYHWQVGLDELLFESMDEDLGIEDGGITYSVGLKW